MAKRATREVRTGKRMAKRATREEEVKRGGRENKSVKGNQIWESAHLYIHEFTNHLAPFHRVKTSYAGNVKRRRVGMLLGGACSVCGVSQVTV
jgi:hypothetical protein